LLVGASPQDPTPTQLAQIRGAIEAHTATRAGSQKGISTQPIFVRLFSPHVPDLSLVDLPGLTMTALTAQGQPKDIKEQIRAMVATYTSQSRTIILLVCPVGAATAAATHSASEQRRRHNRRPHNPHSHAPDAPGRAVAALRHAPTSRRTRRSSSRGSTTRAANGPSGCSRRWT